MMKKTEILGYVNCVNRPSRLMKHPKKGYYKEIIANGAFNYALAMYDSDLPILIDHNKHQKIASTKKGVNYLFEDNIGLKISVDVSDALVIQAAKSRQLKGWSFSFQSVEEIWSTDKDGTQIRIVKKMKLNHISLVLKGTPAYECSTYEIRGQPFTPTVAQKIELDLMNKEFELLKMRGRFSYDGN